MYRKRIIKYIVNSLPQQFNINKNKIYNGIFRHVVRGILIEGTPYNSTCYLRDFTLPLFRTISFIHVQYSPRLSLTGKSDRADLFSGTDEEIAIKVINAVGCAGLVDDALAGCTPARFLQRCFPERTAANPDDGFDLACAAALSGDASLALRSFDLARDSTYRRAAQFGPNRDHDAFLADIDTAIKTLGGGLNAFQSYMDGVSKTAAATHGFCAPTTP